MWFKLFNINRVQVNKVELTALFSTKFQQATIGLCMLSFLNQTF